MEEQITRLSDSASSQKAIIEAKRGAVSNIYSVSIDTRYMQDNTNSITRNKSVYSALLNESGLLCGYTV